MSTGTSGMERAVATPYVPNEEPVEAPTTWRDGRASLPNPDAEAYLQRARHPVCDPASLPGPIRRVVHLQGRNLTSQRANRRGSRPVTSLMDPARRPLNASGVARHCVGVEAGRPHDW